MNNTKITKSRKTFIETIRDIFLGFTICFILASIIATIWVALTSGGKTYYLSKQLGMFITEPQYWLFISLPLIILTIILYLFARRKS